MTIANMTTEWGALAGVFPFDEVTRELSALARAASSAIQTVPEHAERRVAPVTPTPTSMHGGRIEAN